ncbi:MAG: NAD(P)/FAD-dependent oxidoreductase [Chloroflexi bacterium]|nr:NAD(P)/FAD-dependent oxidoreductase [Chloroflexota bacterium]
MPSQIDTIVIGAGPSGSHCARLLSQRGKSVLVLEKKLQAGTKHSCTGIIGMECLRLFPSGSVPVLTQFSSATFFSPSGKPLKVEKPWPQACMVDRPVFDNQLVRMATEAGAEYSFDTFVEKIEVTPRSVKVTGRTNGRTLCLEAKTAIVAGGFGTRLPDMLGLGRIRRFAMGCQGEVETTITGLEVYCGHDIAPGFFGWLVPFAPGKARLGLLTRGSHAAALMNRLWEKLRSSGKVISPLAELHFGVIPLEPLRRTYTSRVLVVGDAAGQVKPTTGGGIYYGLLGAAMAADCLDQAIRDEDFSPARLSGYQRAWRQKLYLELKVGQMARRIFEKLSDRQIDHIFDIVSSHRIHEALLQTEDFSFDWHGRLILSTLKYEVLQKPLNLLSSFISPGRQTGKSESIPVSVCEEIAAHGTFAASGDYQRY